MGEDLDERIALEHFLGKDRAAAIELFRENDIHYISDLMWMGDIAFTYYLEALIEYLRTEARALVAEKMEVLGRVSLDTIHHTIGVVSSRLKARLSEPSPALIAGCRECLKSCSDALHKLDYEESIYGDLKGNLRMLHMLVESYSK